MNKKYTVFKRKNTNPHILPKNFQNSKIIEFFVKEKFVDMFPKKGISYANLQISDFVFADGKLIKNILGETHEGY